MAGIKDLEELLLSMSPKLISEEYVSVQWKEHCLSIVTLI
jgi:hypothetical protein